MSHDDRVPKLNNEYEELHKQVIVNDRLNPVRVALPVIIITLIIAVLTGYTYIQRKSVVDNAEQVISQMSEYIASNISNEIDYGESSIKLAAVMISQTMTSEILENPSEVIMPMVDNTPFGGIEYIRTDGMNVMNIGEPFDASDRIYYIEGIKGNTGIWNNYHPKTSKETLMNFYTPLIYEDKIAGVITGYIAATSQIAPMFETKLYGHDIVGILVDENSMVICSTIDSEYTPDLSLDMFMNRFGSSEDQKRRVRNTISSATETGTAYKDPSGQGRICVAAIPGTEWKVAIIVPAKSFNGIISKNTRDSIVTIVIISVILISYAADVLLRSIKRRKDIAKENAKLEEENRIFNEQNKKAFEEISEIRDIIASANMGTWRIELVENEEPRMYVDETMKKLLGISRMKLNPEETYKGWFDHITPDAVPSVLKSVERMEKGYFDENTYLWIHPSKGERYVRCGGTSHKIPGGYVLRGYHYDVDDVVREDQAKVVMLQDMLDEKNEYYSALGTLGGIYNSMHVIDLVAGTVVEFKSKDEIREIISHEQGIVEMMSGTIGKLASEEYREKALEFTDLLTVADRMKNRKFMSMQFIGNTVGWCLASFITMEADAEGRPTKVIFTTRSIDEEKRQEEKLIRKSQTDELTGFLNRRAYEEDIYEHNDLPDEEHFIYMSLDVNGLKIVNDSLGHAAGDELLIGSCQCMRRSLGSYGKLYRTGGDEFVAILFCDTEKLKEVLADFDERMSLWSGALVSGLSISYGWVSKDEEPGLSVRELGVIADKRMYEAKSAHYRKAGVDRRGQQDAHKALCGLYTKILKVNLSDDSYQIVNMDMSEQAQEKGFASTISEWLTSFGKSGYVHPDDLQEYLEKTNLQYMKEYFAGDKTSLNVFYRRRYGEEFKQVMMEIIPANDYTETNQSLFLYVKNIDK